MLRNILLIVASLFPLSLNASPEDVIQKELARLAIPAKLIPPGKQPLFLTRAAGVQVYTGEEKEGKLQWSAGSIPEAILWDFQTAAKVGTHAGGPTWMDNDGSKLKLKGDAKAIEKEPSPNLNAVAWLLIPVESEGKGRFEKVTHVQRVDTWGGKAIGVPTKAGEKLSVQYQATYVFLGNP